VLAGRVAGQFHEYFVEGRSAYREVLDRDASGSHGRKDLAHSSDAVRDRGADPPKVDIGFSLATGGTLDNGRARRKVAGMAENDVDAIAAEL
jgi:hypothetical protein